MTNAVNWFEIPCKDLTRAVTFYETVLGITLNRMEFMGVPHGIFPYAPPSVGGALVLDQNNKPATTGSVIFLNAGPALDPAVDRVAEAGGKVLMPATDIGDQGFMAMIVDSEGNRVGLHSPKAA